MSESESELEEVAAISRATDPVEALRDALSDVLNGLIGAGCGPQHLAAMTWEAPDPAAFHPARHAVDLAYREVFAGFRPPITLRRSPIEGLTVRARLAPSTPAPKEAVYRGYTLPQLAREYSPRTQADMKALFRQWSRDGAAFQAAHGGLDLAYGPGAYERLDLYRPQGVERPPLWVFLHGGYWQASDKAQHAQFARGMLEAGYAVAMPNYGLAPDTPLTAIVDQIAAALRFLVREADSLGIDAARLHLAGHSAGAHLAAMALLDPVAPPIKSALLLSGLFDLMPLGLLPIGKLLGLDDPAYAEALSPIRQAAPASLSLGIAVGARESDEFKRQSAELARAWHTPAPLLVFGAHHFSLLDGLNGGPLLALAREVAAD